MLLSSTQEIKIVRRIFGPAVVVAAIAISCQLPQAFPAA
jgi:hypothetical protein